MSSYDITEHERRAMAVVESVQRAAASGALEVSRPGKCSKCGGRTWGDDRARGTCTICTENPTTRSDLRVAGIPPMYRWARLEQPIRPPGWTLEQPLISEKARTRALAWANGEHDGPKNTLTIACERNDGSITGAGKSSLAAAIARHIAEQRKLSITWVHASELRADQDDRDAPAAALRRLLRAPLSVLDGLGKELGGAQDVKGWQPSRTPIVMEYAARMYENDRGIRITTIDLPGRTLAEVYGADFVRRFGRRDKTTNREENATIITL